MIPTAVILKKCKHIQQVLLTAFSSGNRSRTVILFWYKLDTCTRMICLYIYTYKYIYNRKKPDLNNRYHNLINTMWSHSEFFENERRILSLIVVVTIMVLTERGVYWIVKEDDLMNTMIQTILLECVMSHSVSASLTPSLTGSSKYPRPVYCGKGEEEESNVSLSLP